MDPGLNNLLKWGIENSSASINDPTTAPAPTRTLDAEALKALMGGPSDADMMKLSMDAILSPDEEVNLENKLIAFDNFEQLIENLDNANNMEPLGLWTPLLSCLAHPSAEIRTMAAWCAGTAVQNNEKSQERLMAMNGIVPLARIAVSKDEGEKVRRKAIYALSSACRNYQPAMDVLTGELGRLGRETGKVDACDMDACDGLIEGLKRDAMEGKEE